MTSNRILYKYTALRKREARQETRSGGGALPVTPVLLGRGNSATEAAGLLPHAAWSAPLWRLHRVRGLPAEAEEREVLVRQTLEWRAQRLRSPTP